MNALEAQNVYKIYKSRTVVNNVTINVSLGEVVGLLGPNGAGKTTTFYIVVGLVRPDKGRVLIGNTDISSLPMYKRSRKNIGYLAQEASIFKKMSVMDNILSILEFTDLSYTERKEKMEELLEELHITKIAHNMGYSLSGGERRRVEIARALATSPKYMLLDEPFAGVDPIAVNDIQKIISLMKSKGLGILITDHNVRETLEITDRAYIMNEGQILVSGNAETIIENPLARQIYLGEKFTM